MNVKLPRPKTLMQRALVDLSRGPDDIVELFGPTRVREITIAMLRGIGCKLEGDAETVELLIQYAREVDVEPWLRTWHKSLERPQRGRPSRDFFDIVIYAAAMARFRNMQAKQPAALATKWLGAPATKDRVEKGDRQFRRVMPRAYANAGQSRDTALLCAARLLFDVTNDLEALDAKIADECAAATRAKKDARYGTFSARLAPAN